MAHKETRPKCPHCNKPFGWFERVRIGDGRYACPHCQRRVVHAQPLPAKLYPWQWDKPSNQESTQ